jgi:hypothetical protein
MKVVAVAAAVALLAVPATALALAEGGEGNAPRVKQPEWAEGVIDVVNLKSRVYYFWVNGNENFYYRGDAKALNEALRTYAAVKADQRRLVLLPGRKQTMSLGRKTLEFNWQFHVPSGIYLAITKNKNTVLTAYLDAEKPRGPVDRQKVERCVRDLDDETFAVREAASGELEKLGAAAKPLLREALKASKSAEARRRIEAVLAKLNGIDTSDLDVPAGLTVLTASDLVAEHLEGLKDADQTRRGLAVSALSELAPFSDKVVPALADMLKKDRGEYARRIAASGLGHAGVLAKDVLPALKEGLDDPDANVRSAFRSAIDQIEQARPDPDGVKEAKKRSLILKDIDELKQARKSQSEKRKPAAPTKE